MAEFALLPRTYYVAGTRWRRRREAGRKGGRRKGKVRRGDAETRRGGEGEKRRSGVPDQSCPTPRHPPRRAQESRFHARFLPSFGSQNMIHHKEWMPLFSRGFPSVIKSAVIRVVNVN